MRYLSLGVFVALIAAVQLAGSLMTIPAIPSWYASLDKPFFNPPNWVFGPVWTVLYLCIAIAGWRIWRVLPGSGFTKLRHPAMRCYALQLLANGLWSPLFFGLQAIGLALVDIGVMLGLIGLCLHHFKSLDKIAFYLFIPYAAWVAYASLLNAAIWVLNR